MTHPRREIRMMIAAILAAADTDAGTKVYPSRVISVKDDTLPCILVYTNSEEVSISQESPREYRRALKVVVDIRAKADEDLDDVIDALALQIENALMQDYKLGDIASGAVSDVVLQSVEIALSGEGEAPIGSCAMTYEVTYYTEAVTDATSANGIEDLETVHADIDQPGFPEVGVEVDVESTQIFATTA